jgi:hypothetical protein
MCPELDEGLSAHAAALRASAASVGKSRAAARRRREQRRSFSASDDDGGGFHARLREQLNVQWATSSAWGAAAFSRVVSHFRWASVSLAHSPTVSMSSRSRAPFAAWPTNIQAMSR